MNSYESLFTKDKIKPRSLRQEDPGDDEETDEQAKEEKIFTPFSERKTHWGDKEERPRIPNVATVIPPGLPPPILKTLLLRMQLEEALYNVNHLETDAQLAAWCEESLDTAAWGGRMKKALESKAKVIIAEQIRVILHEIDEMYPMILPGSLD